MESKNPAPRPRSPRPPASSRQEPDKVTTRDEQLEEEARAKEVFVISPIGSSGTEIHRKALYALKFIFRRALEAPEWNVRRADDGKVSDSIGAHVIRSIIEADLIIADLTGHNPNVFYELAVAHAFKKPVVHLISKGESLPFDVIDQRTIHYDITDLESVESAVVNVREYAHEVYNKIGEVVNPLTTYESFDRIRKNTDPDKDGSDPVADALESLVSRLGRIERSIARLPQPVQEPTVKMYSAEVPMDASDLEWLKTLTRRSKLLGSARESELDSGAEIGRARTNPGGLGRLYDENTGRREE